MSIPHIQNKSLVRISRFDYLFDGIENEDHSGPVQLEFLDGTVLEMDLMPDGQSVEFTWKDIQIITEEDKKSDWYRIDLSDKKPFDRLIRKSVKTSDDLLFGTFNEKKEEMSIAGFGFQFENGHTLVYYNDADNAKIYVDEMPPIYTQSLKLVWNKGIVA